MKILKNSNGQIVTYNNDPIIAEHTGITPLAYTVTFMVDGAVKYIISVDAGCSINEPPAFSDVTRAWCGWWTNDTMIGGTKITFPYTPTADITIYGILSTLAGQKWQIFGADASTGKAQFDVNFVCTMSNRTFSPNTFSHLLLGYYFNSTTTLPTTIKTYNGAFVLLSDNEFIISSGSTGPIVTVTGYKQITSILYGVGFSLTTSRTTVSNEFEFIDGTDIANPNLISWLMTYGTRIS